MESPNIRYYCIFGILEKKQPKSPSRSMSKKWLLLFLFNYQKGKIEGNPLKPFRWDVMYTQVYVIKQSNTWNWGVVYSLGDKCIFTILSNNADDDIIILEQAVTRKSVGLYNPIDKSRGPWRAKTALFEITDRIASLHSHRPLKNRSVIEICHTKEVYIFHR